jgi:tRNA(fMet)-specific endonuclease VapC
VKFQALANEWLFTGHRYLYFFLQGKYGLSDKIGAVGIENCFISEITIAELLFGAENSTNYEKHIEEVSLFEQHFRIIPIYNVLTTYAKEKTRLKKKGSIIAEFDLLIGSTALAHNLIMVTGNGNHFGKIQGIQIEDWIKH